VLSLTTARDLCQLVFIITVAYLVVVEETTQSGHLVMTLNSDGRPAGPRTIVGLLPEAVVGATDTDVDHAAGR
jgi:hypothetical protein